MSYQVLSSNYIVNDKWMKLRSDKCIILNGKIIEPYYVIEYPDWVNVVPITKNNEIIMIKQYRHGVRKDLLELPSGGIENNDKSPVNAAKRELVEETGYETDKLIELCRLYPNPSNQNNTAYSFLALDVEFVQGQMLDETEQIEVVKIPIVELKTLLKNNQIYQPLHIAALYYAFDYIAHGA